MATANKWGQLRQQARSLESQTEDLFHRYSAFTSNPPAKPTPEELDTEKQLEDILAKRESTIGALSRLLDSESALTSSATKLSNLTLHRTNLSDHRREFTRIKSSILEARNKANLLSSVRNDINAYRSASRLEEGRSESEYMLDERNRLDSSHNMADSVLSQAYAIHADFGDQRARLAHINSRIMNTAAKIPVINQLVGRISSRKRRDSIIMAGFIAFCFLMVLYFR